MQIRTVFKSYCNFSNLSVFSVFCFFFDEDFKNTNIMLKCLLFRYLNLTIDQASEDDVIYMCIEIDNP